MSPKSHLFRLICSTHRKRESYHQHPRASVCSIQPSQTVQIQLAKGFVIDLCVQDTTGDRNVQESPRYQLFFRLADLQYSPAESYSRCECVFHRDRETMCTLSVIFITKGLSDSSICCPHCVLSQEAVLGFLNHSPDWSPFPPEDRTDSHFPRPHYIRANKVLNKCTCT